MICRPSEGTPVRAVFGPDYWFSRCDGFQVVNEDGRVGVVAGIVMVNEVAQELSLRFGTVCAQVALADVVVLDAVHRLVTVDCHNGSRRQ
jgi:hypothetical protein